MEIRNVDNFALLYPYHVMWSKYNLTCGQINRGGGTLFHMTTFLFICRKTHVFPPQKLLYFWVWVFIWKNKNKRKSDPDPEVGGGKFWSFSIVFPKQKYWKTNVKVTKTQKSRGGGSFAHFQLYFESKTLYIGKQT